ncbi:uncharacterized protein [Dysidea avara]|uniref:uncharacterized protein n=1 Tax=Dysidea avara TaxID=196820 RepID=UPI00332857AB
MREEIANLQSAGQEGTTPDEALASSNDERLDTNLSGDVKKLYEEFDADFDLEERCWLLILEAVHHYYESRRRKLVTNVRPDRVAIKEANGRNTKVRSRQKALYDRCKKLCVTKEEKKRWREIIPAYMTEESDDGEGSYRTHSPSWRSTELEDFIQELDQKWTVKSVLKKPRVVSTPLVCEAPRGAPAWAVRARSISPTVATAYHDAPQNGHQLQSSYTEVEQVEDQLLLVVIQVMIRCTQLMILRASHTILCRKMIIQMAIHLHRTMLATYSLHKTSTIFSSVNDQITMIIA